MAFVLFIYSNKIVVLIALRYQEVNLDAINKFKLKSTIEQ
jgi:hypothetical protein